MSAPKKPANGTKSEPTRRASDGRKRDHSITDVFARQVDSSRQGDSSRHGDSSRDSMRSTDTRQADSSRQADSPRHGDSSRDPARNTDWRDVRQADSSRHGDSSRDSMRSTDTRQADSSRVCKGDDHVVTDDSAPTQMAGDTTPTKLAPTHEDVSTRTTTQADAVPKRATSLDSAPIGLRKASITDSGGSRIHMRGADFGDIAKPARNAEAGSGGIARAMLNEP